MIGFDGDPEREATLRAALVALLDAFPEQIAKPREPAWSDRDELRLNDQFDAILRAHKKDRLAIPIQALRVSGAAYHGFTSMRPRRLAWFVPSLLASWLDRAPGPAEAPFGPGDIEDLMSMSANPDDEEWWTDEETSALEELFTAALDAALATPLREAVLDDVERPLENGVRVWSRHSPSVPLTVLRVARALLVDLDGLVVRWALDESPIALEHLLEAVYDTKIASKHLLSHEAVADRLGSAFFEHTGETQARLSKAEATVRRNIKRREDV